MKREVLWLVSWCQYSSGSLHEKPSLGRLNWEELREPIEARSFFPFLLQRSYWWDRLCDVLVVSILKHYQDHGSSRSNFVVRAINGSFERCWMACSRGHNCRSEQMGFEFRSILHYNGLICDTVLDIFCEKSEPSLFRVFSNPLAFTWVSIPSECRNSLARKTNGTHHCTPWFCRILCVVTHSKTQQRKLAVLPRSRTSS